MNGDKIADENHIARLCMPKSVTDDGQIEASAFILKANEESLSVNWLEYLNCSDRSSEIAKLRGIYSSKLNRVGLRAKIAVLNVGEVRERVLAESPDARNLKVLHEPIKDDISHSGIHGLRPDNELIAELIRKTVRERETYPARN